MVVLHYLGALLLMTGERVRGRRHERDRGDVPGWVMVTVMTAILVVAILGIFEPQIKSAITHAINSVTNSK
jgi:hypothetical protein